VTYSIVARDQTTGELGVAVQSDYFSVGHVVPWAEPGVGAVATQSIAERSFGPLGLAGLRDGGAPQDVLTALLALDPNAEQRQVALVDARGRVAAHTGSRCIAAAGHRTGDGYSVQANMMERATVWDAMAEAFEAASGPLPERMVEAMRAAEREGGDIRGRQSSALLVVSGSAQERSWAGLVVELRVENHPEPVEEIARLVTRHRAMEASERSGDLAQAGDFAGAAREAEAAIALAPSDAQIAFWSALVFGGAGRFDEARAHLRRATQANPRYAELLRRLPAAGLFPDDDALIEALLAEAP
jgi:uncharacterized Ntn-hydrolase superfamily protein